MEEVTGFVLAGGKSSRMGGDKALLEFGGKTLLARAVELLGGVTAEVRIVGARAEFAGLAPVVEDAFPGCGPLAGIHAALASSARELNLVLAVDLPFVTREFLQYLVRTAGDSSAVAVVPRTSRGYEPLCAVYRRGFKQAAEEALRARRYKIDALFAAVETREVSEEELARFASGAAMFDNLNTREDLEKARRRL